MKLIACTDRNGGIGKNNLPLFSISGDLRFFKEKTMGHTIIMGRKTLDSLPCGKPLPDRTNIVLSRDPGFARDGVRVCNNSGELALLLRDISGDVYVIGGGEVYRELLPFCDTAYITVVDADADADTFLPKLDPSDGWQLTDQSPDHEENGLIYRFLTFERHI
ncbi:MAG: dihydrofolate reductase [Clostridia bacterium]|nr:dihydrofolate reductase [Clostridia bacterium]